MDSEEQLECLMGILKRLRKSDVECREYLEGIVDRILVLDDTHRRLLKAIGDKFGYCSEYNDFPLMNSKNKGGEKTD